MEADVEKLMKELEGIRLQITQPLDYATREEQLKQWSKIWNPDLPAKTKGGAPYCPDHYKTFLKQLKRDLLLEKDYLLSESKQTRRNKFSPKMVSRNRVWNKSIWDELMAPSKPEVKPTKRHDEDESNKRMAPSNPYVEPTKRHDEDESKTLFDQDNHDDKDTKDDEYEWDEGYFHGDGPVMGKNEVTVGLYRNKNGVRKKDEVHEEFSEKQPVSTPTVFSKAVNTIKTQAKSLFGRGGKQKRKKTKRKRRK